MATTSITITADEELLERARQVAEARHTTVPELLGSALETISNLDFDESKLAPLARRALGLARGMPARPYKELIAEALSEKYRSLE